MLLVKLIYAPDEHCKEHYGIDEHARIEAKSEGIHEEQLHVLCHFHEARYESEENQRDDGKREEQRQQRALGIGILEFLVVEHKHDCRNTKQIEQVHCHRHAYHIGYEHQPAVAVRLVGAVFPFQDEPEHQGGAER